MAFERPDQCIKERCGWATDRLSWHRSPERRGNPIFLARPQKRSRLKVDPKNRKSTRQCKSDQRSTLICCWPPFLCRDLVPTSWLETIHKLKGLCLGLLCLRCIYGLYTRLRNKSYHTSQREYFSVIYPYTVSTVGFLRR